MAQQRYLEIWQWSTGAKKKDMETLDAAEIRFPLLV